MSVASNSALGQAWTSLRSARFEDAELAFGAHVEDRDSRAEAYEGLAWIAWYRDEGTAAIDAREKSFAFFRERGSVEDAARVALWLAVCHLEFRGDEAVAHGWFSRAAELLESVPPCAEHGWMALHHAAMAVEGSGDALAARDSGRDVGLLARDLGDVELENVARAVEGLGLVLAGDVAAGMKRLGSAAAAALAGEVSEPVLKGWACCYAIYGCEAVGDYSSAAEWCRQAIALSKQIRMPYLFRVCRCHYAAALIGFGDWSEAERELDDAVSSLRGSRPAHAIEGIVRLADLRRRQGSFEEALRLYAEAEDHPLALLGRAAIALERGEIDKSVATLDKALRRIPGDNKAARLAVLDHLVEARLAQRDLEGAAAAADELDAIAQHYRTQRFLATSKRRRGDLLLAGGEAAGARDELEQAIGLFRAAHDVYELVSARTALARAMLALGDRDAAREEAGLAAEEADRLGARSLSTRARVLLGGKSRTADQLTARESEILQLIGEGLTDRLIAERLQLSSHTVHRHVANIRTKLGVPSRAAAVAYAREAAGH